ncbi:MAG TPA: zeta toxin family protein [Planctomycetota bacterium]|nr:zeta toxin family protein [Planctomycetota bacterium]
MVAGPNGSGKTTLIGKLRKLVILGIYVNADDLESTIAERRRIDLRDFGLHVPSSEFRRFFKVSEWRTVFNSRDLSLRSNCIISTVSRVGSYHAACIADFIRQKLLEKRVSFTFETVMSHPDKVELLSRAKSAGYRTYLYYVATENQEINVERVASRIEKGGHAVSRSKVVARYKRSLGLLASAIKNSSRAFIFDNSKSDVELKLEVTDATLIRAHSIGIPDWIAKFVIDPLA